MAAGLKASFWLFVDPFVYLLQCLFTPSPSFSTRLLVQRWDRIKLMRAIKLPNENLHMYRNSSECSFTARVCLVFFIFWFVAFAHFSPRTFSMPLSSALGLICRFEVIDASCRPYCWELPVDVSASSSPPLPLGFVTLTTGRGSAGAECWALSLTVIINNLEPQKWAMRLLDTLSCLKRLDALSVSVSVSSSYPLVCLSKSSAYALSSASIYHN